MIDVCCFYSWKSVFNCVPQGLVLGSLLFIIFINNLDVDVTGMIIKSGDDMNNGDVVDGEEDSLWLQHDIPQLIR